MCGQRLNDDSIQLVDDRLRVLFKTVPYTTTDTHKATETGDEGSRDTHKFLTIDAANCFWFLPLKYLSFRTLDTVFNRSLLRN